MNHETAMRNFAPLTIPPDVEAGAYVHSIVQAVAVLADAVNDPRILSALDGLDAMALEKATETILTIVEDIDG